MSQVNIKVNSVRSSNSRLKGITSDLTDTQSRISNLRHSIDSQITSRQGIGGNLSSMASSLRDLEKRLNQLNSFVDNSVTRYEQADRQVNSYSQKLTAPPKKSFWESVGKFFGVVGDSVKGFATGLWDVGVATVEGIWNLITHPVETFKGLVHVIQHPIETAKGIWDAIKTSWNEDVINGNAESRGNWFGRAFGEIALAVVGTKGVDKAVKLTKGAKIVDEVGGVRVVDKSGSSSKPEHHESPRTPDTISPTDRAKLDGWTHRPDNDLYLKYKEVYDNPKYYNQENGAINWPGTKGDPNIDGFKNGEYKIEKLKPGSEIDRYGSNGSGQYFSPSGSSYESRALPPHMTQQPYNQYTVIREFDVRSGEIAPWFDEVGGGTQYYSKIEIVDDFGNKVPATVENLIKYGYIK